EQMGQWQQGGDGRNEKGDGRQEQEPPPRGGEEGAAKETEDPHSDVTRERATSVHDAPSSAHRFAGSLCASRVRPSSSLFTSRSTSRSGSSCASVTRTGLSNTHRCHRSPGGQTMVSLLPSSNFTTSFCRTSAPFLRARTTLRNGNAPPC